MSADLKALSDHKATSGKPEYTKSDRAPFSECAGSESKAMIGHVTQVFKGDPRLTVSGFAVDGDGTEVFYKLRKTWLAKECENHEAKGSQGDVTYVEVQEIQPPDGLDAESWFGACYSGFRAAAGESGRCVVVYRAGDNGIAQITSTHDSKANRTVAGFLQELVAEVNEQ